MEALPRITLFGFVAPGSVMCDVASISARDFRDGVRFELQSTQEVQ